MAKGWTVVILIMILDVDVTAERRHYKICGEAATTTLGLKGRQTYEPSGQRPVNLKNLFPQPFYTTRGEAAPLFYKTCGEAATTTL